MFLLKCTIQVLVIKFIVHMLFLKCVNCCEGVCVSMVGGAGGLDVKILPRTAKLEGGPSTTGPPPEQDIPLDIPKRTAVYIEQVHTQHTHMTVHDVITSMSLLLAYG